MALYIFECESCRAQFEVDLDMIQEYVQMSETERLEQATPPCPTCGRKSEKLIATTSTKSGTA